MNKNLDFDLDEILEQGKRAAQKIDTSISPAHPPAPHPAPNKKTSFKASTEAAGGERMVLRIDAALKTEIRVQALRSGLTASQLLTDILKKHWNL